MFCPICGTRCFGVGCTFYGGKKQTVDVCLLRQALQEYIYKGHKERTASLQEHYESKGTDPGYEGLPL